MLSGCHVILRLNDPSQARPAGRLMDIEVVEYVAGWALELSDGTQHRLYCIA